MHVVQCSCEKPTVTLKPGKFIYTCTLCNKFLLLPVTGPSKYVYVPCLSGDRLARDDSKITFNCDVCKEAYRISNETKEIGNKITLWRAVPLDKRVAKILELREENMKMKRELQEKEKKVTAANEALGEIAKIANTESPVPIVDDGKLKLKIDSFTSEIEELRAMIKNLELKSDEQKFELKEESFAKNELSSNLKDAEKRLEEMEEYTKRLENANAAMLKVTLNVNRRAHDLSILLKKSQEFYKTMQMTDDLFWPKA